MEGAALTNPRESSDGNPVTPTHHADSFPRGLPGAAAPPAAEPEDPGNAPLPHPPCDRERREEVPQAAREQPGPWGTGKTPRRAAASRPRTDEFQRAVQAASCLTLASGTGPRAEGRACTGELLLHHHPDTWVMLNGGLPGCPEKGGSQVSRGWGVLYLPAWRHRCASRYFTSDGWLRLNMDARAGV